MSLTAENSDSGFGAPQETVAVYSAPDMISAELLRGQLTVEGIDAIIGEQVTGAYAGALVTGEGYAAEVRVPADSVDKAEPIVLQFLDQMKTGALQPVSDEELAAQAEAAYDPNV